MYVCAGKRIPDVLIIALTSWCCLSAMVLRCSLANFWVRFVAGDHSMPAVATAAAATCGSPSFGGQVKYVLCGQIHINIPRYVCIYKCLDFN